MTAATKPKPVRKPAATTPKNRVNGTGHGETDADKLRRARHMLSELQQDIDALALRAAETAARLAAKA